MKWVLVAIVMNMPIKTDLVFDNLASCLEAEAQMRKEWAELYKETRESGAESEKIGYLSSQMTKGTCIPAK